MKFVSLLLLALLCCQRADGSQGKTKLSIGAIFDIETRAGDENSAAMIPAVQMALRHVNSCPKTLVDYELELDIKDVKCSASDAIRALIEFIRSDKTKIMLLGPGCSKSSEPFAQATPFYNLVQVSMASSNPALSCAKYFPTFVRTIPPEHFQNRGRAAIAKHFGWKHVAVLWERLDTFQGLANDLVYRLKKTRIEILTFESFDENPDLQLENIQKKDARIIFGIFSEKVTRRVMCESYKRGMYGAKYVWILMSGSYNPRWWTVPDTNCTAEQIREALGHFLGTQALMYGADDDMTVAKKTVKQLWLEYQQELKASAYNASTSSHVAFAYDAVWTVALTLNKAIQQLPLQNETKNLTLEDFNYNNREMRDTFMKLMKKLTFTGMSGHLSFYKSMDRLSYLVVDQFQGEDVKQIATYCMKMKALKPNKNNPAQWNGGKVPDCKRKTLRFAKHIQSGLVFLVDSLCIAGIVVALAILMFNIKYRNIRYIKMSSPRLNTVIILGCILIYASGILLGMDGQFVSEKLHTSLCQVQTWTMSFGFTMALGGLFSKTWRVHQIFTNQTKRKVISDFKLLRKVGLFLIIDIVILTTWQIQDPLHVAYEDLPTEIDEVQDIATHRYISYCDCKHKTTWMGVLFIYKGIVLLLAAFLAWASRKVYIAALNDSKVIGLAVYNVFIPCALVIPVLHTLHTQVDAIYALGALLCVFCTSASLAIIFIPKIIHVYKHGNKEYDGKQDTTFASCEVGNKVGSTLDQAAAAENDVTPVGG